MKRVVLLAASVFLSGLLITAVNAQQLGDPAVQQEESLVRTPEDTGPITKPKAGISWREMVVKQRNLSARAAEQRAAMKRDALMGLDEQMPEDTNISAYNAAIRMKNAQSRQE